MVDPNTLTSLANRGTNASEPAYKLDDVEKVYFAPSELDKAADAIKKIEAIPNVEARRNYTNDVPPGYGMLILPISKRDEAAKKRVNIGVAICAVPSLDLLAEQGDKGMQYVVDAVIDAYAVKINNAIRPKADGSVSASIPFSVDDFLTSQRGKEGFKVYSEIADDFVAWLREKGLKSINKVVLRRVLQSKVEAEQLYPRIPQGEWNKLLDSMVAKATKLGKDPATLVNWKNTREQVQAIEDEDISEFGGLEDLEAAD